MLFSLRIGFYRGRKMELDEQDARVEKEPMTEAEREYWRKELRDFFADWRENHAEEWQNITRGLPQFGSIPDRKEDANNNPL